MTIQAWHFLREDKRLQYPPHTEISVGVELVFDGGPILCRQGFHASERLIDALGYAPGPILTHCELSGDVVHGDDKLAATKRKVLWMADISTLLHEFACDEAERALNERKAEGIKTYPESFAAIEAKRKWLRGDITDAELLAARSAAESAWSAAWAAESAQNERLTARVRQLMEAK